MSWSIPNKYGYGSGGEDYLDFVWHLKRLYQTAWLRHWKVEPLAAVTSIPVDWENEFPEWDFNYYCAWHDAIEIPSHPWMAVTCPDCWHTFASKREVTRVAHSLFGEWRAFDEIFACPHCGHDF